MLPTQELVSLLQRCKDFEQTRRVHGRIITSGIQWSNFVLTNLLNSCNANGNTDYAKKIFEKAQNPDVFAWNSMIRGLCRNGLFRDAISAYAQMRESSVLPISFTFAAVLKACARILEKKIGWGLHSQVCKFGFDCDVYAQTSLVDMYSKFGDMRSAQQVFDGMPERNVVSWNSVISGYVKCGELIVARKIFDDMPGKDVVSWNTLILGYVKGGDMNSAMALFYEMPERNPASWNTLIGGYIDSGNLETARQLFDSMPEKSNVSLVTMISGYARHGVVDLARELFDWACGKDRTIWNAMIACYAQNGRPREAINLFNRMLECDVKIKPDKMTIVCAISASSQLGDFSFGLWIQNYCREIGMEMDDHLITSLVDLYAKCGNVYDAYSLFLKLRNRDVVAYTAIILGCAMHGRAGDSILLFNEMVAAHVKPNSVTFIGLLTACNHCGLVDEGLQYFLSMSAVYGLHPSADHYVCMVDLLGRAGRLDEAYELIRSMPMTPHTGVWGALLLACNIHCNVKLGEIAAHQCFKLEPEASGYYVLLCNIYASAGRWDDAKRMRKAVEEQRLARIPGCSWIEIDSEPINQRPFEELNDMQMGRDLGV
ncbi:pentatricopeptide repeat-containing protein At4g22760 [Nymphaea colorata]|uniref:Pentacotripeptide-repeat region of PRORP domain-containing protein n=1 Tax=Nymphaea colorata TaxID=210225 RepID=A0A5K0ZRM3_9MAGN|nr:pentatricopeptide repeat-containing protein At4g22760 [Nymphaea colorata]XP_031478328.1 pentatricopeptide repeat-containing protein At4g22760 [Nymphaea colorata]XP_031478329.1 pentatricopeptide repeat-containing protein At4g22760 [Nymphaea colorata]XP_049931801.1 pentatricopeptide repeat-containing protein At4g22760 [Nymphaea colorata]XP_049931802.1 pentatricopeptide repeat-containing protein At4g22760 [Nymphaea colorata]